MDYSAFFQQVRRAMTHLGLAQPAQIAIFKIVATVLTLGNIEFVGGSDGTPVTVKDESVRGLAVSIVAAYPQRRSCVAVWLWLRRR
jgi:myosin heavy subunit